MPGPERSEVLALFGPTGVGKTAIAIAIAERLRARGERPVAVSADALQLYAGLEILTGAANAAEQARLEHRLLGFLPIDARCSAGEFAQLAHAEIDGLIAQGAVPIVVGGTGLYLRAALADLELRPPAPPDVRQRLEAEVAARGAPALHAELARRAPWAAEGIAPTDRQRIVRALELDAIGALEPPPAESQLWTTETRHPTRLIGLVMEREALYARIDARVDAMVAAGAIEEVEAAHRAGASRTARAAIGFEPLLAGDIEGTKSAQRAYARRQLTWMRRMEGVRTVDRTGLSDAEVAGQILEMLDESR
jgi:tRNA dimethylallyltransferase